MPKKKKGDDDGLMSLPECASYLHLSENTVLKLANENKLPGVLVDRKWQFQRELIDEWLQERLNLEDEGIEDIPDPMRVPLGDLLPIEAVLEDLKSTEPLGVIEELAALAYNQNWLNDKPWFIGALVEREALASTAMEGGVAFLHTRSREAGKIARPFVIVGRSYSGVDFGAPDGKPTFLFFLLGLKYDRLHLPILGRLARTMLNPATIGKLRSQPSVTKMRALLLKEDANALLENKQVPVQYEAIKPKLDRQMRLRAIMRLNAMRKHEAKKAAVEAKKKSKKTTIDKSAEPKARKAATVKPGASKPGASKPGASKPGASKPGASKPGASRPGASRPGASRSGASKASASKSTSKSAKK